MGCRKGRRYSGFRFRLLSVCLSLNTDYLSMKITQGWPNAQDLNLGDGRGRLIGSERENTGASAQSQFTQSTGGFSALVVVGVGTLVLSSVSAAAASFRCCRRLLVFFRRLEM